MGRYHVSARSNFSSTDQATLLRALTPPPFLTFTKEDYENSKLQCVTNIKCKSVSFGFTAESVFYRVGSIKVDSVSFSHHQQYLQMTTSGQNGQPMKMELRYAFFSKLNFEIVQTGSKYSIKLTVVYSQTPLFYRGEQKPNEQWIRYIRFDPQTYDAKEFWHKVVASNAFQMSFSLNKTKLFSFLDALSTTISCSIIFSPFGVGEFNSHRIQQYCINEMETWPWNIRYCIEALKSLGNVGLFFMDHILFVKNECVDVRPGGHLNEAWVFLLFTAAYEYLRSDLSLSSLDFNADKFKHRQKREDGFVLIKTVYITPTRTILIVEEASMNCRGFRELGVDNLIQVKFRDDTLCWFPIEDQLLNDVVRTVCRDGIQIAGRNFFEFGGSSSLFREHGSYFYAAENKNEIVDKWRKLGDFKFEAAAKVQARLGQYFTSAREIRFKLRLSDVGLIGDYMSNYCDSANNPYCFSDGCGIIDPLFARRIADELQLPFIPSAFQFRFAGFKGIVAVDWYDRRLKYKDGPYFLLLRHSQKKFGVVDDGKLLDFDVVQWSSPSPSKLHGAFIAMMDSLASRNSNQKIVRDRIRQLQNDSFIDVIKPLIYNKVFLATLEKLPKYVPIYKMKTKNLLHEPFLRGMVEANAVMNARLLVNKNQIAIPPDLGRGALGIVDTTGSLKEGQVFFQFSQSLYRKKVAAESELLKFGGHNPILKVGRVGVTKSPIYHIGDIRFLEAVEAPLLMDKIDVIVFPAYGTRPHTDEIGGGDIDGDWYTIFWDPELLMNSHADPSDYTPPSDEKITKVDLYGLQRDAPDIRVQYMKSNNLEQLSTTHLAHLTLHDPLHEDCVKLTKKADTAVNFFKSGLKAEELEDHERPGYWPKFMQKRHEPEFRSPHILNELHDKSTSILYLISIAQREAQKTRKKSGLIELKDVVVTDYDRKMFNEYKEAINALKVRYQIKSEGELFSNSFVDIPGTLRNYKDPMGDDGCPSALVQRQVFEIFERFRTKILDRFASRHWRTEMEIMNDNVFTYKISFVSSDMIQLAQTYYAMAEEDGECYSFPWIIWEGLDAWLESKESANDAQNKTSCTFEKEIWDLISTNTNYAIAFVALQQRYPNFPWFSHFAVMFNSFMLSNDLLPEIVSAAVNCYMDILEDVDRSVTIPKTATGAFFNFLITIISPNFKHDGPDDEEEYAKLLKAAQSTLISYAFFPQNEKFGIKLHEQVMLYPQFVISVPSYWAKDFERKYKILQRMSGCEQVVSEKRKCLTSCIHYTIMCRGTLECCQKLETMLTPFIKPIDSKSIKETKTWKARSMRNLLMSIFGFRTKPERKSIRRTFHYRVAPLNAYSHRK